jgi:hypothetical protein
MANSIITQRMTVKQKTETVTFDANGFAETTIPRENALVAVRGTGDWETFLAFANNYSSTWRIISAKSTMTEGATRTVVLYYV